MSYTLFIYFLLLAFRSKNKRDYSQVTDCLYYELCPKHSILRPNNALFLCFFRIKNFYSCVLVTDYSIIKRNHHHHHRQNVTPAYRRDTTRSKPAIGAIETKEYLPSIARETERERETERQRKMELTPTNEGEKVKFAQLSRSSVSAFGGGAFATINVSPFLRFSNYSSTMLAFVTLVEESERREKARDFINIFLAKREEGALSSSFSSFALTKRGHAGRILIHSSQPKITTKTTTTTTENVELGVNPKRRRHLVDGEWKNVHGMKPDLLEENICQNVQALEPCSFVRQLNNYGFRKCHSDRFEFGVTGFEKNKPELLTTLKRNEAPRMKSKTESTKNIKRKESKTSMIKATSTSPQPGRALPDSKEEPPTTPVGRKVGGRSASHKEGAPSGGHTALELGAFGNLTEEVDQLKRDRMVLLKEVMRLRLEQDDTVAQMRMMEQRVQQNEQFSAQMRSLLETLQQNPKLAMEFESN